MSFHGFCPLLLWKSVHFYNTDRKCLQDRTNWELLEGVDIVSLPCSKLSPQLFIHHTTLVFFYRNLIKKLFSSQRKEQKTGAPRKHRCDRILSGGLTPQSAFCLLFKLTCYCCRCRISQDRLINIWFLFIAHCRNVHPPSSFVTHALPKWALLKLASFQFITSDL